MRYPNVGNNAENASQLKQVRIRILPVLGIRTAKVLFEMLMPISTVVVDRSKCGL
jgi:hypothetical protein